jgi:ribose transport system substrate-binding protein
MKKRQVLLRLISILIIPMLILAFCVIPTASSSAVTTKKKLVFVMVPKGVHPYYIPCYQGFVDAAKKYGVTAEEAVPQQFSVPLQVQVIEDLIVRKVAGIAISCNDDVGLHPVIAEAIKAGIKVITFDAPAPTSEAPCYIGTNNVNAGAAAAKQMAKLMGYKGNLIILQGGLTASNLNLRTKGFKTTMAKVAPKIKIVALVDEGGDLSVAQSKTEEILVAYPKLNGIFVVSGETSGAYRAIKDAVTRGKLKKGQNASKGKLVLGGFDDTKDTLLGIKEGYIAFCLVQKTYKMGWLSIQTLLAATQGKPIKSVDTGMIIVTKSNMNTYMNDMKKEFAGATTGGS